jgi:hypothetical protein
MLRHRSFACFSRKSGKFCRQNIRMSYTFLALWRSRRAQNIYSLYFSFVALPILMALASQEESRQGRCLEIARLRLIFGLSKGAYHHARNFDCPAWRIKLRVNGSSGAALDRVRIGAKGN